MSNFSNSYSVYLIFNNYSAVYRTEFITRYQNVCIKKNQFFPSFKSSKYLNYTSPL